MDDQTSLTMRRVARRGLTRGATLLSAAALVGAVTAAGVMAADPSPSAAPVASAAPSPSSAASPSAAPRVIELYETSRMQILGADGQPVTEIAVRPGETVEIVVGNQARFAHNLAIGPLAALKAGDLTGLPAVEPFTGGSRTITWTVPEDVSDLWFGCTVVGHLALMQGRFVVAADSTPDPSQGIDLDAAASASPGA